MEHLLNFLGKNIYCNKLIFRLVKRAPTTYTHLERQQRRLLTHRASIYGDIQHRVHLSQIHLPGRFLVPGKGVDAALIIKITIGVSIGGVPRLFFCVMRTLEVALVECDVFHITLGEIQFTC